MIYYLPSKVAKTVAARSQVARTALAAGSHEFRESQSVSRLPRFATQSFRRPVLFFPTARVRQHLGFGGF